jgi:RNA polymerase sigma-32 factor
MTNAVALPALSPEGGLRHYLQEIQKFPMLEAEEEYALAKRWADDGDYEAAQKLVTSHLRLVAKIAMGFRGYGLPVGDLIAEGNLGLMQAVKKFDPEKGFRLSTYAMWWIKASIQEFVLKSWSLVKMGTSATQKRLFFNLKRLRRQLNAVDDASLTPDQINHIASTLEVNPQDVMDMDMRLHAHDQNLNARIAGADGDGGEWMDLLADESDNQEVSLGDWQDYSQKRALMQQAMATLNAREMRIIEARRLSEEPLTLEALSEEFGVSRERVRQIEARALEKLTAHVALAAEAPLKTLPAAV